MTNYTTNLAPNPGLQLGLSGYAAISGATITETAIGTGGTLFGNPGLLVKTPGAVSGEGVITPATATISSGTYSVSVYVQGITSGNVTVYAISNPGGIIVGSAPVMLKTSYQRVVINSINFTGSNLSLMITTTSAQPVQFWITNVQIEPESPAHPYCDGGQTGCSWTTTVGGTSFQQFRNVVTATSNIVDSSDVVSALIKGEVFNAAANPGADKDNSNVVSGVFATGPIGAVTDFSIFSLTDPDPVQTYVSWNNAGVSVPTSGYVRSFGSFFPPQDYVVSNNNQIYKRAAYMAVGWQFSNVPNTQKVIITDVQAEIMPYTNVFGAVSPTAYALPRSVNTIVKPDRLNYCTNPSFENGITGWSAVGSATLSQDASTSVGEIITIDDSPEATGTASLNVATTHNIGDGASIQVTNLIAGDTYIVSAYVQASTNVNDILMTISSSTTSVIHGNSGTGYDEGGYGTGFYGGNPPASTALSPNQWFRIYTTFQPVDSTATLQFTASATAATTFWIDAVLIEAGEVLSFYFDGNFGKNFFWETGGTPGLTRSYYYDEYGVKTQAVINVLERHTPYGISFSSPQYFVPPTQ